MRHVKNLIIFLWETFYSFKHKPKPVIIEKNQGTIYVNKTTQ
jgi:hypothetical protein